MKKSELKQLIKEQISMMGIVGLQAIGSPFMSQTQEVIKEEEVISEEISEDDKTDIKKAFTKAGFKIPTKEMSFDQTFPGSITLKYHSFGGYFSIDSLVNLQKSVEGYTNYTIRGFSPAAGGVVVFQLIKRF